MNSTDAENYESESDDYVPDLDEFSESSMEETDVGQSTTHCSC